LATCFGSSEPSSGQFLIYRHGAFSECAHYGIPYCLQTILFSNSSYNLLVDVSFEICLKTSTISTLVNPY